MSYVHKTLCIIIIAHFIPIDMPIIKSSEGQLDYSTITVYIFPAQKTVAMQE